MKASVNEHRRIIAVGINFKTAPVELRERLAFTSHSLKAALETLIEENGFAEAVILSTCNRAEIYALAQNAKAAERLRRFLSFRLKDGPSSTELGSLLYAHIDRGAVEHLFAVACGIDSQVLGEPQILGQVQAAFEQAMHVRAAKSVLSKLFQWALSAGKRARAETQIGRSAASIGSVAVELAKQILGDLSAKKILLIGSGKMSELAAKNLLKGGARKIKVANRTYERAQELARRLGGRAIRFEELQGALVQADVVISSTAAPSFILRAEQVEQAMRPRAERPLLLIDIAVPRDIDPEVKRIPNVFLHNIDDLKAVAEEGLRERHKEVSKVKGIIREEVGKFMAWFEALDAVPAIVALRERIEGICRAELARAWRKLPGASQQEREVLEELSRRIAHKFLHEPTERLKRCPDKVYREALCELFGLKGA